MWLYVDAQGDEQGPFAATQMQQWAAHHQLPPETLVRHVSEAQGSRRPLHTVVHLGGSTAAPTDPMAERVAIPTDQAEGRALKAARLDASAPGRKYDEYVAIGNFNIANGRFTPQHRVGDAYWASKSLPPDRAGRMMAHYFDFEQWQDRKNQRKHAASRVQSGR